MLQITSSGSFDRTDRFLSRMSVDNIFRSLTPHAERGVVALSAATPVDSGATADAWSYEIHNEGHDFTIWWKNNHLDSVGTPIVIMLQLGHGTGTGGYVQGRDFINPAIRPIFDQIVEDVWREVTSA